MAFDTWDDIFSVLGAALGSSMSTVGAVTLDESSLELGSAGGLGAQFETSSMSSGEITTQGAPVVGNLITAPSEAGGAMAGTTVVGGTAGTTGCLSSAAPDTSSGGEIGHGNINGNPFHIWEDSSGGINIDYNTVPYSRVEKRAQQTYDALHGEPAREYKFPAVVIESSVGLEAFRDVFADAPSPAKIRETLLVLEQVLMREEQDGEHS